MTAIKVIHVQNNERFLIGLCRRKVLFLWLPVILPRQSSTVYDIIPQHHELLLQISSSTLSQKHASI